jgi:hypothetical protein
LLVILQQFQVEKQPALLQIALRMQLGFCQQDALIQDLGDRKGIRSPSQSSNKCRGLRKQTPMSTHQLHEHEDVMTGYCSCGAQVSDLQLHELDVRSIV